MKKSISCLLPVLILLSISCEREIIDPIDIFATERLTNPHSLNLGSAQGLDSLYVNADRIITTPTGYHIKGTIFSKSLSGIIPVTSGDFSIATNLPVASLTKGFTGLDFKGYGTANFPETGILSVADIQNIPGSEVYYNTGKVFKADAGFGHLPLLDDRYYFRYKVDKEGDAREYRMKNISVKLHQFYLDARDPSTTFVGDIYSQSKAGVKTRIVEKGVVGISANELWEFIPFKYSDNLEKVTGGTGFEPMKGGVSLSGIIPIKKYPLEILGQAVINTSFSSSGPFDFFDRGFEDASFRLGVNGELFFTSKLLTWLTNADTVKLGQATLQAEFGDDDFSIRLAGEYSDDLLDRFLGKEMMKFIPYNAREGVMYLRGTNDPDDFLIYMEEKISMNIPGLGITPIANSLFKVTKEQVGLSGSVNLPFNIGIVEVTGILNYDGTFLLKGVTNCTVNLGSGLNYEANLEVEVSEKGVKLLGDMSLPYGIGDVEVAGGILIDELYFSGKITSAIPFPVNASVGSDLAVSISTKTGISLNGAMTLPGGIGNVSVTGVVNTEELLLTGTIGSGLAINFGNVDVTTNAALWLTASSTTGVRMGGSVSLPFSLGNAGVTLRVTSGGLSMSGSMSAGIRFKNTPVLGADIAVSASTTSGLYLDGEVKLPGKFGWVDVYGYVRNSGFNLSGEIGSSNIDFGIISLGTSFSMSVSNTNGVRVTASGNGCVTVVVDEICDTVGVDVDIDFFGNSVELCMDFPVIGSACVGW
jgi:hypothetical protein